MSDAGNEFEIQADTKDEARQKMGELVGAGLFVFLLRISSLVLPGAAGSRVAAP